MVRSTLVRGRCLAFATLVAAIALGVFLDVTPRADDRSLVGGSLVGDVAAEENGRKERTLARSALPNVELARSTTLGDLVSHKGPQPSRLYPIPPLEPIDVYLSRSGDLVINEIPSFATLYGNKYASLSKAKQMAFYSVDPQLQKLTSELIRLADAPHIAIVAMEPSTGRILAMGQKSAKIPNLATHAGFPAASLFKVVTTAATLERTTLEPESKVRYRGGTYELERWNYLPDPRRDKRTMSITEALGRSCNAVFGRLGGHLNSDILKQYSRSFGFNSLLKFERPLATSAARIPSDGYGLSRTAAGFGDVSISPIHAASLMSGIANDGWMPRPILVDKVISSSGGVLFSSKPEMVQKMVKESTAHELLNMMESTTTQGTSRREFIGKKNRPLLGNIEVAAKTGTLRGSNPVGLNHWFIAAAPKQNPKIALAIIAVDPKSYRAKPSRLGRLLIEEYLKK